METGPATVEIARGEAIGKFSRWQVLFIAAIGVLITICEWVFAYQNVAYGIVIALGLYSIKELSLLSGEGVFRGYSPYLGDIVSQPPSMDTLNIGGGDPDLILL